MTAVGEYTEHEALAAILDATAVRSLMDGGATHEDARAVVDSYTARPRPALDLRVAPDLDTALASFRRQMDEITELAERVTAHLLAIAMAAPAWEWVRTDPDALPWLCPRCHQDPCPQWHPAGPRTRLRCPDCRVQWRLGMRFRRLRMHRNHDGCRRVTGWRFHDDPVWAGWHR